MGCVKKLKKKERGYKKKKLGPLADSAHSEAEDDKKLWKQESHKGMDSLGEFSATGDLTVAPILFTLNNLLPEITILFHPEDSINVGFCLQALLEEGRQE